MDYQVRMLIGLGALAVMLSVVKFLMDRQIKKQQKGQASKRVRLTTDAWIVGDLDAPTEA